MSALVKNACRNKMIADDIIEHVESTNSGIALILSERVNHCNILYKELLNAGVETRLLTGSMPTLHRKEVIRQLSEANGNIRVLVATTSLIGEGFDLKALSSVFLVTPIKFTGRLKQCVGRILRVGEGKTAEIYDYVDSKIGVLKGSFKSRQYAYNDIGIKTELI